MLSESEVNPGRQRWRDISRRRLSVQLTGKLDGFRMISRHRVGISQDGQGLRRMVRELDRPLKRRYRFLEHFLLEIRVSAEVMRNSEIRIQFERVLVLLDCRVVLALEVQH